MVSQAHYYILKNQGHVQLVQNRMIIVHEGIADGPIRIQL